MTDLSTPKLSLADAFGPAQAARDAASQEKLRAQGFRWPTPPFAGYPKATEQTQPEMCAIEGLNGKMVSARLIHFVPEQGVANVQVPPARTTMPLSFSQFRTLTLAEALLPMPAKPGDPHADVLNLRTCQPFHVHMRTGDPIDGETLGHVETEFGLFLFMPKDERGGVLRCFVPREAFLSYEFGSRLGDLLIEDHAVSEEHVTEAAALQEQLRSQKIGDILVTRHLVTPEQLLQAIEQQSKMPMVRIGEALLAMGMVSQKQLDEALEQQKVDRGVPIGEVLVRLGRVSRQDLQTALARKMGYPIVDVANFPCEAEALRKLPQATALRLSVLPLLLRESSLVVAVEDPSRRAVLEEIEFASQCKVVPVLARHMDLRSALVDAYGRLQPERKGPNSGTGFENALDFDPNDASRLLQNLEREGAEQVSRESDKQIEESDNSLVRLINTMIIEAATQGVSDIHIENYPGTDKLKIRFRKDGMLRPYLELPHTYRNAIISRIKVMCSLDISERRKPQDGKINFAKFSPQHQLELRVATIPTNNGLEDVVMRLLASAKPVPIDKLGLSPRNLMQLRSAMERPYGLVLCVGPTGSGKTTTLHSAVSHINVPERKIWTAEDPIEITQPGLRQVQVNPKIEWTFAKALRAFLRADPDVIMVGEVRDTETARISVEASLTGHLVLSTLHTNSAPETVTRLLDMGLDPFNFADSLLLVLAQRLVRRLCVDCKVARPMADIELDELLADHLQVSRPDDLAAARAELKTAWLGRFGQDGRLMQYRSPGCAACANTGFRGRCGVHELMTVSRDLRRQIQTGARAEELQQTAVREGMLTLRQDGIEKVLQGLTTIDEVRAISNV